MHGDIQYVSDTFLIERFVLALSEEDEGLTKEAFDLSSILGGLGSSIKSFVGSQIHGKDAGGIARTVTNFLVPGIFFKLHPILGIIAVAAQSAGFDLFSIFDKITSSIKPKIEAGQPVSAEEVNSAAQAAMPSLSAESSLDLLAPLRELEARGGFKKEARGREKSMLEQLGLQAKHKESPMVRMFSFLSPARRGSIIVGILAWFLKTVLLSAGLLAVGGAVAGAFGKTPEALNQSTEQAGTQVAETVQQVVQTPRSNGAGAKVYKKSPGDLWIEYLGGDYPEDRLLEWTYASYPDLYQYQDIIQETPSFQSAVSSMTGDWRPGDAQISVPDPYKSRDEIISLFVDDVYRTINQRTT